jgi:hypothetical protein
MNFDVRLDDTMIPTKERLMRTMRKKKIFLIRVEQKDVRLDTSFSPNAWFVFLFSVFLLMLMLA